MPLLGEKGRNVGFRLRRRLPVDCQLGHNAEGIGPRYCPNFAAAARVDFAWDVRKAARDLRKHGVSFDEAATVFLDSLSATDEDPDYSLEEQTIGDVWYAVLEAIACGYAHAAGRCDSI
jgi:hypothetical protein